MSTSPSDMHILFASPQDLEDLLSWYEPVTFEHIAAMQHDASWADVAAKAKRLVQQGKVTILRNAPHHVMAHVVGDGTDNGGEPDEHDVEISRHDPASQIIEQWNCDCAWAQYAFDRTRKWKKFEGRVCSHVLATYWKARSTPLDLQDQEPGFQSGPGQKIGPTAPGQQILPGMTPDDLANQQQQQQPETLPDEDQTTPPSVPPPAPSAVPPSNADISIPKQPTSPYTTPKEPVVPQRQQLQLFDITAPPGMQPTPQALPVSTPGGRPPTPGNPVQFPGTFSHFIPVMRLCTSRFIYANDPLTDYFEQQRAASQPIYVSLNNLVTLEQSGGKIPVPGAKPYDVTSENIPLYDVMDLGYNPATGMRETADVNALQGAPEQTGTYADVVPNKRGEVLDFDPDLKMAYVVIPLHYPEGGDARLHPHSLKGWVDYKDLRPAPATRSPWRR